MSTLNTYNLKSPDSANTNLALDASGNVAIQAGSASTPSVYVTGDANTGLYSPGADQIAVTTGGTARVYIDSSGRVGIGTTSPGNFGFFAVRGSAALGGSYGNVSAHFSDGATTSLFIKHDAGELGYFTDGAVAQTFYTSSTERARIDSSGRLLVGTSSGSSLLTVNGTANISGATVLGSTLNLTSGGITNGYTGTVTAGNYEARGSAPSITLRSTSGGLGNPYLYFRADGAAGKSIIGVTWDTTAPTLIFEAAGNEIASLTPQGAFSCAGTGRVNDGISASTKRIGFSSSIGGGSGGLVVQTDNPLAFLNRLSTDGALIEFYQAGTSEGSISVSGTTVSYNGGHISRWSQILGIDPHDKAERPEILRGTVMSNLDEMCEWIEAPKEALLWQEGDDLPEGVSVGDIKEPACSGGPQCNEQLNKTKISDVEGDKNVAGVFQSWDDDDDTWVNDYYLAMTGDFVIRIAAGVTVERGDLLMSTGDGTAKPQNDDIIRSKTIAKVTSTTVSCTYEDGSYCVPCVLMAC